MGQCAEDIINGDCNWQGDYTKTNTAIPRNYSQKETTAELNIRKVRKELAMLIKEYESNGTINPVNTARKHINIKYGRGWRERGLISNGEQWKPLNEYK